MKQLTITTQNGTVHYTLAANSALPTIKAGLLTFTTKSGVQSVPAAQVQDFEIESVNVGSKTDRLKTQLDAAEAKLAELAKDVHDVANDTAGPELPEFTAALRTYAVAAADFDEQRAKRDRFLSRRAGTLAKREAEGKAPKAKAPKAAPTPAPSPTAFAPEEPIANAKAPVLPAATAATPKPSAKKSSRK